MSGKIIQKTLLALLLILPGGLSAFDLFSSEEKEKPKITSTKITGVSLEGRLVEGNVIFDLFVKAEVADDKKVLSVLEGKVALIDHNLGKRGTLKHAGNGLYTVSLKETGKMSFLISFAVKKEEIGEGFLASFKIPEFQVRQVSFNAGSDPVELHLSSLIETKKTDAAGEQIYSGFMKLGPQFTMSWKPVEKKLEKELSLICQSHSVVNIGVGNLKVSSLFNYKVVQGSTTKLALRVPASLSVTRVVEPSIRDWELIKKEDHQLLEINFKKKMTGSFQLLVEGESAVDAFPANVKVSLVQPEDVVRVSGFLALGTDSAVKLLVDKTEGLTQVEPGSFHTHYRKTFSAFPKRSLFVYNFAALPVNLEVTADKVKSVMFADNQFIYSIRETDLQLKSRLEVEVRDATVRELTIDMSPNFNVSSVRAADLSGYEAVEVEGRQKLKLYFRSNFMGKKLIDLSLEWSHKGWQGGESLPSLHVEGTRTSRGFISISAEDGLLTDLMNSEKLRKIPVASLPLRAKNIQSAWRFKEDNWNAELSVKRKKTALYSELFHLYSLGENVIYGSVSITYHISGAPLDVLKIKVPAYCKNPELTGRHRPRLYVKENDEIEVKLQRKIAGDYNLLLTFEISADTHAGSFSAGGIETIGTDSETGFITISGSTGLQASVESSEGDTVRIDPEQVPSAYRLLHSNPVHLAFKYVRSPHSAVVKLSTFDRVSLLDQVLEHCKMATNVNAKGERVTEVNCWLKNSNKQHFVLTLPEGSSLWSVQVDGKHVRCTTQDGNLQIPVPRNADPNKTIHVKFTYADKGEALKEGSKLTMNSPSFSVPSIYNEWKLNIPGGYSLYEQAGSMKAWQESHVNKRADILGLMESFADRSVKRNSGHAFMFIFALIIIAVSWNISQIKIFGSVCGFILVIWSAVNLIAASKHYHIPHFDSEPMPAQMATDFKKTVSAAGEVQEISAFVSDNSVVYTGQSEIGVMLLVGAVALLILAIWLKNFIPATAALVLAWLGCRGSLQAEFIFAGCVVLLLPAAVAGGVTRLIGKMKIGIASKKKAAAAAAAALIMFMPTLRADKKAPVPVVKQPIVQQQAVFKDVNEAVYRIEAKDKTARVLAEFEVEGEAGEQFLLLTSPCALVETEFDKEKLKLITVNGNCIFRVLPLKEDDEEKKKDKVLKVKISFDVPLQNKEDRYGFVYYMPKALKNRADITTNKENQELISPRSVYFVKYTEEANSAGVAIFSPGDFASFYWKPKLKKVSEIKPVYYAETNSMAIASEGHVDLQHNISLQVARGQLERLLINIPAKQSVTSVKGDGLVNWAFDPKTRKLELLMQPQRRELIRLLIMAQLHTGDLPYAASVSLPEIEGAGRQHGLVGLSSREGVKVSVADKATLQGIDAVDFQSNTFALSAKRGSEALLFPFRYFKFPVNLGIKADKVLPEIEVHDNSNFSIGDERLVLSSSLKVQIKKAGVFELKLSIPADYEIESLSANGISHWDEISKDGSRYVLLYFKNRIKGLVEIKSVMIKNTERKSGDIEVPALHLEKERKHRGELIVSAEKGNRLEMKEKAGVGGMALIGEGVMTFSILKEDWKMVLTREVLQPRIEVNYLETVKISDNRYNVSMKVRLNIENAGTKFLNVTAPADAQSLEIRGRDIAKTEKLGDGQWRIEFKRKIFGEEQLQFQYQAYYDPTKKLTLDGIQIAEANRQRGYLCLFIPGYMSGTPQPIKGEMQNYEARLLPTNLSSPEERKAAFCFRIMKSQWQCDMQFVKHIKANVLQATVKSLSIKTMVSLDGRQLHLVSLQISGGSKNFLTMQLPKGSSLSSVFSDGEPLQTAVQNGDYLIPLNQSVQGAGTRNLQIIYIQDQKVDWNAAAFEGPKFDLPLKDINWYLYVPNDMQYDKFTGSMSYHPETVVMSNSMETYLSKNRDRERLSREMANSLLKQGYKLSSSGRRDLARKTFESVVNLSDSMSDINEDARIQLQTALRRQTMVGLVNRRESLKSNVSGETREFDERKYNDGYFSDSFAKSVEKALEDEDSQILSKVSDKIMSQQKAAMQRLLPLRVTLPEEGSRLHFYREVQIEPLAEMKVSFKTKEDRQEIKKVDSTTGRNAVLVILFTFSSLLLFGTNFNFKRAKKK